MVTITMKGSACTNISKWHRLAPNAWNEMCTCMCEVLAALCVIEQCVLCAPGKIAQRSSCSMTYRTFSSDTGWEYFMIGKRERKKVHLNNNITSIIATSNVLVPKPFFLYLTCYLLYQSNRTRLLGSGMVWSTYILSIHYECCMCLRTCLWPCLLHWNVLYHMQLGKYTLCFKFYPLCYAHMLTMYTHYASFPAYYP